MPLWPSRDLQILSSAGWVNRQGHLGSAALLPGMAARHRGTRLSPLPAAGRGRAGRTHNTALHSPALEMMALKCCVTSDGMIM